MRQCFACAYTFDTLVFVQCVVCCLLIYSKPIGLQNHIMIDVLYIYRFVERC